MDQVVVKNMTSNSDTDPMKEFDDQHASSDTLTLIVFGVSILALLFFFLLELCPPLCRSTETHNPRRYEDRALKYGEV